MAPSALAGIGDVDPGYGVNGRFEARRYGQFFVYPPLADGRLLYPADGGYRRTDANGLPDGTFGSGGVQAWPQGYGALGTGGWARAGDGRLFVAVARAGVGGTEYAVLKLGLDGAPDPAFGTDGVAAIDVPADGNRTASAFCVQPDGKLLLLLQHHDPADWYVITDALLVRLLPDGRLDATFGDSGSVVVSTGLVDAMDGVGLNLLADGRISVFGKNVTWLTPSGKLDDDQPDGQEWPIAAPLPGGGAIAWARTSAGYRLAKVMVDGSFDTSFGPNGDGTVAMPARADYFWGSLGVSPDGRYIFVEWGGRGGVGVSRLIGDGRSAGQIDTSFGDQGTVDLRSTNASSALFGLADGGAIITTADYAYRLLGRDAPSPGFTGVDLGSVSDSEENYGSATMLVFRAAGSDGAIRLRYWTPPESELPQGQVSWATPGVDFDAVDEVVDWSAGDDAYKLIRIRLRADQVQEGTEQIYVRFEALSPGTWTVPSAVAVAVRDSAPPPTATGGQSSGVGQPAGGGKSAGGGSFGWPGLLLLLAAVARRWVLRAPALVLLAGSAQAQHAPGDVDPGFVYPQPTPRETDSTNAVALPSGFMIVKSREAQPPSTESTLALTLIDQDGRVIDYSFGTDGTYTNRVPGAVNVATAAIQLSSGTLLLGGFKRVEGSTVDSVAAIAKVDRTGALDPAFGAGGVATFDVQGGSDRVGTLAELPDGRIAALVWSRQYSDPYGDCDVTWMVLVLLSPDGQHTDVADARLHDSWAGGCRDSFTMSTGPGGVLLYGNELNVFDGSSGLFPINWRYGPFAYDPRLGLVSTTIDGSSIGIVVPAARPPGNLYPSLRTLVGFDDEQVTYTKLVPDLPHERFYLGFSTDGGRVAIARFRLDGSLDTGWGRGGAVVVQEAGWGGVWLSGGLATDLRLLAVQQDGSVVVVTADGIVRRLAGGNGVAHGVFKLDTDYVSVTEGNGSVPIWVQRVDGASGVVTVDLVIGYCASASTGACGGQPDAATPGEDFVETQLTLEYSDGDTSPRRVDLKLLDDSRKEPTEMFRVKLLNPTGGAEILGADAWVYVQDNDGGPTGGPSPGPGPVGQGGGGGLVGAPLLTLLVLALALRRYRMRPGLRSEVIVRNGV